MTCIRCGHEHERKWSGHQDHDPETCIANLRADLEAARQMVADAATAFDKGSAFAGDAVATLRRELEAERARSWHGWAMADEWERRFVAWVSGVSLPALFDSWRTRS